MAHLNPSSIEKTTLKDLINNFDTVKIQNVIKEISSITDFSKEDILTFVRVSMLLMLNGSKGSNAVDNLKSATFEGVVNVILQQEQDEQLGYSRYTHTNDQEANLKSGEKDRRNGTRNKKLQTALSDKPMMIKVPRNRNTKFVSQFLVKDENGHYLIEKVESIIMQYCTQGLSIDQIIENLKLVHGLNITRAYIQKVYKSIVPIMEEWLNKVLAKRYLIAYSDCIFMNVRDKNTRKVSKLPVYIIIGVTEEGYKEVIHLSIGSTESATRWHEIFMSLKERGTECINILCADGLVGMEEAFKSVYADGVFQTCCVHLYRNCMKTVSSKDKKAVSDMVWAVIKADDEHQAKQALYALDDSWGKKYPRIISILERTWDKFNLIFNFPKAIRKQIYTTNIIESFNRLIRKSTKNQTSFTSVEGLLTAIYLVSVRYEKGKGINPAPTWNSTRIAINEFFNL